MNIKQSAENDGTVISNTQPQKNMKTMRKGDTSVFYDDDNINYTYILPNIAIQTLYVGHNRLTSCDPFY